MIDPHALFADCASGFLGAFGAPVAFTRTDATTVTFDAIVRMETDVMSMPDSPGVVTDLMSVRLASADAATLSEGATFTHSGRLWRLAGARVDDGRAMSHFDAELAE